MAIGTNSSCIPEQLATGPEKINMDVKIKDACDLKLPAVTELLIFFGQLCMLNKYGAMYTNSV